MKREFAAMAIVAALAGGFLLGRAMPAHHYQRWAGSPYLIDTSTGRLCPPTRAYRDKAEARRPKDVIGQAAERLKQANPTADDFVPACK